MHSNIFIIGAGRLGTTLGCALQSEQFRIKYIYCHSDRNNDILQKHFPDSFILDELDPKALNECDVYFLTLRDDILPEIVHHLKKINLTWSKKIFIHTSGILSSSILQPLKKKGSDIASMHPMQTFSKKFIAADIFHGMLLTCEGTVNALNYCRQIAKKLKADFLPIDASLKVPYHLAGTFAANLFISLIDISDKLFAECGIPGQKRRHIIESLTLQVIENFIQTGVRASLTGPLERGDILTIGQHQNYLAESHPEMRTVYQDLSKYIFNEVLHASARRNNKLKSLFE